ncbi:hypothetical protein GCM10009430_48400 [Aquimarina litoralis]|uniref:Type II toxin-antitoxin system HicB family antitoxin n=1 Tax=Aquimarina litoralis TaxID=584605 RepID=A0ABN1JAH3_9FLAO
MKITGTIIKNEKSGNFIAFINEYPGVLAQGKSEEETKGKLEKAFDNFIDFSKKRDIQYSEPNTI